MAGLVCAGVGTYLWLTPVRERRVNVAPQLTDHHAGIVVTGAF